MSRIAYAFVLAASASQVMGASAWAGDDWTSQLDPAVVEQARKEGAVTYYSAMNQTLTEEIARAFAEAFPGVEVNIVRAASATRLRPGEVKVNMHGMTDEAFLTATAVTPHRIRVVNLLKTFKRPKGGGTITPINNISLDVSIDEMVVLLGPSGCGKTTLLRCVAGLEEPDSGEIYINDQLVFSSRAGVLVPPHLRPVSMVFQSYALWPHMSVFDNVAYPLRSRKFGTAKQVQDRVQDVLAIMGLDALARQFPGQLSGGQQQRVALARAIVPGTGVVLFDEPLSNVDARIREQLREEIRRMQRRLKFSALYVTHDQVEAMAVADQIAVLDDGRIVQKGTAEEIFDRPASRYVATFVGGANVLEARIAAVEATRIVLDSPAGPIEAMPDMVTGFRGPELSRGQLVDLVLRPEMLAIEPSLAASAGAGRIESRTFLGTYVEYVVAFGEARLRVNAAPTSRLAEGESVVLSVPRHAPRAILNGAA